MNGFTIDFLYQTSISSLSPTLTPQSMVQQVIYSSQLFQLICDISKQNHSFISEVLIELYNQKEQNSLNNKIISIIDGIPNLDYFATLLEQNPLVFVGLLELKKDPSFKQLLFGHLFYPSSNFLSSLVQAIQKIWDSNLSVQDTHHYYSQLRDVPNESKNQFLELCVEKFEISCLAFFLENLDEKDWQICLQKFEQAYEGAAFQETFLRLIEGIIREQTSLNFQQQVILKNLINVEKIQLNLIRFFKNFKLSSQLHLLTILSPDLVKRILIKNRKSADLYVQWLKGLINDEKNLETNKQTFQFFLQHLDHEVFLAFLKQLNQPACSHLLPYLLVGLSEECLQRFFSIEFEIRDSHEAMDLDDTDTESDLNLVDIQNWIAPEERAEREKREVVQLRAEIFAKFPITDCTLAIFDEISKSEVSKVIYQSMSIINSDVIGYIYLVDLFQNHISQFSQELTPNQQKCLTEIPPFLLGLACVIHSAHYEQLIRVFHYLSDEQLTLITKLIPSDQIFAVLEAQIPILQRDQYQLVLRSLSSSQLTVYLTERLNQLIQLQTDYKDRLAKLKEKLLNYQQAFQVSKFNKINKVAFRKAQQEGKQLAIIARKFNHFEYQDLFKYVKELDDNSISSYTSLKLLNLIDSFKKDDQLLFQGKGSLLSQFNEIEKAIIHEEEPLDSILDDQTGLWERLKMEHLRKLSLKNADDLVLLGIKTPQDLKYLTISKEKQDKLDQLNVKIKLFSNHSEEFNQRWQALFHTPIEVSLENNLDFLKEINEIINLLCLKKKSSKKLKESIQQFVELLLPIAKEQSNDCGASIESLYSSFYQQDHLKGIQEDSEKIVRMGLQLLKKSSLSVGKEPQILKQIAATLQPLANHEDEFYEYQAHLLNLDIDVDSKEYHEHLEKLMQLFLLNEKESKNLKKMSIDLVDNFLKICEYFPTEKRNFSFLKKSMQHFEKIEDILHCSEAILKLSIKCTKNNHMLELLKRYLKQSDNLGVIWEALRQDGYETISDLYDQRVVKTITELYHLADFVEKKKNNPSKLQKIH